MSRHLPYYISRYVLGSQQDLFVNGQNISLVDNVPDDAWLVSTEINQQSHRCANTALFLAGKEIVNLLPPSKFVKSIKTCGFTGNIPWIKMIPPRAYKSWIKELVSEVSGKLRQHNIKYFCDVWVPSMYLFDSLKPAKISKNRYASIGHLNNVGSFTPDDDGFAQVPTYDKLRTRTGRLVISDGPNILILKRTHRDVIESAYRDDGSIVYVDFSSLEPRVAMFETDKANDVPADIYTWASKNYFGSRYDRAVVKQTILSEMNGGSRSVLAQKLQMRGQAVAELVANIREMLGLESLSKRLRAQWELNKRIVTRFERSILCAVNGC
jgi:hypothetical protein